jgi:hypothetical protein
MFPNASSNSTSSSLNAMQYYYVNSDGNVAGPEGEEKLRVLYAKGEIKGDTEVAAIGSVEWTNLSSILNKKAKQASKETCPYCRTPAENPTHCQSCGTPHHHECWSQNGGCTVYGCSGAPSEEPRIVITGESLAPATGASNPQSGGEHRTSGNYERRTRIPRQSYQPSSTAFPTLRQYGGIGRLAYVGLMILCSFVSVAVGPEVALLFWLLTLIPIAFRYKNIGSNPWWCLLGLVPVANLFVHIRCLIFQEGWADTQKLDAAGKTISWLLFSIFILIVLTSIIGS